MHTKRKEHDMTDNDVRVSDTADHERHGTGQVLTVEDLAVPRPFGSCIWIVPKGASLTIVHKRHKEET